MRNSLAPLDGTLALRGLSAPVTVTRDTYGIPHLKAQNKLDALRALGFVMASERLFQMELSRRMVRGELSEVFGNLALKSDKLYRSLMLEKSVERMLAYEKEQGRFDEKMWTEMEAYFDGVNQYIESQPRPFELQLVGIKPKPFTPMDAYIMTGHMAYSFGIALKADPVMTKLAGQLSEEAFQALRNDPLKSPLKIASLSIPPFEFSTEGLFAPVFDGSNAWLVSPKRSQSGKSIFANDPHIGYSHPAVWMEAHIQTPEFELYGHYLPLVPFAILGHSRQLAWGFTMSLADDMDLYREILDKEKKTALFKNSPTPYQEWKEVIKVKNEGDVVLNVIETSHGPLMDEVLEEKNLALKWAFHRRENNPMKALRAMGAAKNIKEFEAALQYGTAPGLNVMYADAENIAWWMFGDVAIKKNPNSDLILNGASGEDEYERTLAWQEKPHLVNPPSGIIVTANSRPVGLSDTVRGDWQSDDRFQTISKALNEKDQWSAEDFKFLQTENYNAQTKVLLEKLFDKLHLDKKDEEKYSERIAKLKNWNLRSETHSTEASFYHQWHNENILLMLNDWDEETKRAYLNTPYAWVFYERALLNENSAVWKKRSMENIVTEGFKATLKKFRHNPEWGEIHTVEYTHPLGRSFPLNKIFNLGPYPMSGAYNEINNNKMRALGGDFKVVAGPSTRRIVDFANPQKSWGINPIGISGHLLSPFYDNQVQMFLHGKYREQLMDESDIQNAKSHELILQ
ncbi:penicillin acylase family protein [Bdellovibrio sp. 22V]|uniref:penicillin acylase family protein n=1 Tax=Bdellovibrio TaxID=958 RepID=UPI0025437AB4|nr:penicillin acylase family protein [Bdellovibrio sp. 22V]WII71656.1 penicillin acylase family protein [Bdellovibrio sp. 22V]